MNIRIAAIGMNHNHIYNQVDALLEAARIEQDLNKRMQLYQQAEQILVDDAAALFTVHWLSYELVKPYVQ